MNIACWRVFIIKKKAFNFKALFVDYIENVIFMYKHFQNKGKFIFVKCGYIGITAGIIILFNKKLFQALGIREYTRQSSGSDELDLCWKRKTIT